MTVTTGDEATCAACDERLPASARFCLSCGAPQDSPVEAELRKTVTLLFCDVTGSTALGEQLDPEALRAVMGRYFAVAKMAIQRHGGTVEKFVGDAVLAVFGIPEVREDDALRAVRAAFDMQGLLGELSDELTGSMGVGLSVRTGVNTGWVVSGSARAGGSFATGDAVNTAARLEQAAAPGEVLIGATTWSLVRDAVEVEAVVPLRVKGKAEPLPAYRLVRVLEAERGRSRRLDAALVGRERETLALTDALVRTAHEGRGQFVTVLGPAGMGKSRLVEHFLAGMDDDVAVLRGRCVSYGRGITFWPLVQVLRQAAGLIGEEDPQATEKALLALMDGAPDQAAVVNMLLSLLGMGREPGGAAETFWAVRSVLGHLAGQGPLVVTIDDIHWAEPTLLDLLERLRDEAVDVAMLIVCQARPELLEQRPGWDDAPMSTTFLLEPFNGQDTTALLEGLLGPGVPDRVVAAVQGWTDGNPLFVEEVATHLVEEGVLGRQNGEWIVVGDLAKASVPPTVSALLTARLDRLPPAERTLLERISVIGLEATVGDAIALSGPEADVPTLLDSLGRSDLLRPGSGLRADIWAFRHVLLREAAYECLPKSVRAKLHERVADRLAESATDVGGEVDAFVGHHLEQAVRFHRELANQGVMVAALADRAARTLAAAGAHARDGDDRPAATDLLRRAAALIPQKGPVRRELLWRLAQLQQDQGNISDACETLERVAELMDGQTSALERSTFTAVRLNLRDYAGENIDPAELRSAAEIAARLARQQHDNDRLSQALNVGVIAATTIGQWGDAAQMLREIQEVGSARKQREARMVLGAAYILGASHVDEGLAYYATIRDLPGQTLRISAVMKAGEAALLVAVGRTERALELARESTRMVRDLDPYAVSVTAQFTVLVHMACGDIEEALRELTHSISGHREGGDLNSVSTFLAWKAALLLEQGDHDDQARQIVQEAAAVTSRFDSTSFGLVQTCEAVLAARGGDDVEAAMRASKAIAAIDASDQIYTQADIRRWLSEVPARRGDVAEQRRLLTEARDLYRAKGHQPLTAATEELLSQVAGRTEFPSL